MPTLTKEFLEELARAFPNLEVASLREEVSGPIVCEFLKDLKNWPKLKKYTECVSAKMLEEARPNLSTNLDELEEGRDWNVLC